jgi:NitT/TauT family transport system permease protein
VIFPTTLPRVIDAIRLSIGPAMVYLLAAELLVSDVGFGYRIRLLSRRLDMEVVYPYLALLAVFGLFMDYALRWAQRKLCPWFQGGEG